MMETSKTFTVTREKHLDHMVKVVPFIVFCYAVQSYVILKVSPNEFSQVSLSILGGILALMIGAFIYHDIKHHAFFDTESVTVKFLFRTKTIRYKDITEVVVRDPEYSFSNMTLKTLKGKHTLYFIDDADKIRKWLESKNQIESKAA